MTLSERRKADVYRHIEEQAVKLDEMAAALRRLPVTHLDPYQAASRALHVVAWGTANLNQNELIDDLRVLREFEQAEAEDGA